MDNSNKEKKRTFKRIEYNLREIEKLQKLYFGGGKTYQEMANELNRTVNSIRNKILHMELPKQKGYSWTEDECEFLKNNYSQMNVNEIAKMLNRSVPAIKQKYKRLRQELDDSYDLETMECSDSVC